MQSRHFWVEQIVSYRFRKMSFQQKRSESGRTHCRPLTHAVFLKLLCVLGACVGSTVKIKSHRTTCAWTGTHLYVAFSCWFSLPGWPQMRGKGWCWVAPRIIRSACLTKKLKEQNSLTPCQVHTLGFTIDLTGTYSYYRADGASEEGRWKQGRERRRNGVRSNDWKENEARRGKPGLPPWTYNMVLRHD